MWPSGTTGCATNAKWETSTNKVNLYSLDFDPTTQEYAEAGVVMPSDYNGGTVTAVFHWTSTGTGTGGVVWGVQGVARCLWDGGRSRRHVYHGKRRTHFKRNRQRHDSGYTSGE